MQAEGFAGAECGKIEGGKGAGETDGHDVAPGDVRLLQPEGDKACKIGVEAGLLGAQGPYGGGEVAVVRADESGTGRVQRGVYGDAEFFAQFSDGLHAPAHEARGAQGVFVGPPRIAHEQDSAGQAGENKGKAEQQARFFPRRGRSMSRRTRKLKKKGKKTVHGRPPVCRREDAAAATCAPGVAGRFAAQAAWEIAASTAFDPAFP